jgi:hypothetical protein
MTANIIGVGGFARSGKDTFVGIAKKILAKNGYSSHKVSFADALKQDLEGWLLEKYNISVWTSNDEEKALIRPFLVAHGCGKRIQTQGKYWVDKVDEQIRDFCTRESKDKYSQHVFFVSDVRFRNEANWLHENWAGELVHLKRWSYKDVRDGYGDTVSTKTFDAAPNEEEKVQDPLVIEVADQNVEWESKRKLTTEEAMEDPYLQGVVLDVLNRTKYFRLDKAITGILSL